MFDPRGDAGEPRCCRSSGYRSRGTRARTADWWWRRRRTARRRRTRRPGREFPRSLRCPAEPDERHGDEAAVEQRLPGVEAVLGVERADRGDHQQPAERNGDEDLPAELHELVVAEPGKRSPEPDEDEQEHEQLGGEPQDRPPALVGACPPSRDSGQGARQPPRNSVVANAETVTMLMYSARKKSANFSEEYSVWKPPTSSPSASGRSKGAGWSRRPSR